MFLISVSNHQTSIFKTQEEKESVFLFYSILPISSFLPFWSSKFPSITIFSSVWRHFFSHSPRIGLVVTNSPYFPLSFIICLYYLFMPERYFCWIWNSGLTIIFFHHFKNMPLLSRLVISGWEINSYSNIC